MRPLLLYLLFLATSSVQSQKLEYTILSLPDTLTKNANAIVRLDETTIAIPSQRTMIINTRRIVSVLNEKGRDAVNALEYYDKSNYVKNIEAIVYDAFGNELKKIKRKDFRDQAAVDNATMFSDSRIIYLEYTPTQYPYTIVYESTRESSNTAFIPRWSPLKDYFTSVASATISVTCNSALGFKFRESNFGSYSVTKVSGNGESVSFEAKNIPAQRPEDYSPISHQIFPSVLFSLERFHLEGVDGSARNWKEFGTWYSDELLSGTTALPDAAKVEINKLVGAEKDPIRKARIVYDFVQQKSRYVSIQVGIGGWKPMRAQDVDRLSYGDCKALTNYTRALLEVVGVLSYNTILYAGSAKRDIEADFVSMQGDHMILSIPDGDNYIWLECTSQTDPFGYQGTFTDDRDVLVMKPEGAEIVRTTNYGDRTNEQVSNGVISLAANGNIEGNVEIFSSGTRYSRKSAIERLQPFERDAHYKEYWSSIANLKIEDISFINDKAHIKFTERARIKGLEYGKISGNRMLFPVNPYNRMEAIPKKIRDRKLPFELSRGFCDTDEIEIRLPEGFTIEALPGKMQLETKYGEYVAEVVQKSPMVLVYKRTLLVKKGAYTSGEYENYRQFMERVVKNDNSKLVLVRI
ncbi:MAG TPA: DUF3857 domain-containing protein [Flavobacterium sp.]|jgi:hypothetical protein